MSILSFGTKGERRQSGEKDEGLHHIELSGFRAAAVAQNDAGTEDGDRHVRQQFANHVLAEFLGARVGIVIGAIPVDASDLR